MAQKAIREYHAKKLLFNHLYNYIPKRDKSYKGILVSEDNLYTFEDEVEFDGMMIVKPDQLFGKRGKNGLVYKAKDIDDARSWIEEKLNKKVIIKKSDDDEGISGTLTHFLIEPLVDHKEEYYLAIKTEKENDVIFFSEQGGIDIEENWESVNEIKVPFKLENNPIKDTLKSDLDIHESVIEFISGVYQVFKELNFAYLELNPFVISGHIPIPLDMVARLDSTAEYDMEKEWVIEGNKVEFPKPFGASSLKIEKIIEELDSKTGASLKISILNPNGRVWLLTAGGGASVIYADTVADLGHVDELANYGEYSGNPNKDETEEYCNNLFSAMFESTADNKVLIVGGGIANFTDVAATFKGIIKSIQKNKEEFIKQGIKIFVRRGGPNYKIGIQQIKEEVKKLGIPIEANGPEKHMTRVVKEALN